MEDLWDQLRLGWDISTPGASIPMGQGGHVPPIFGPGEWGPCNLFKKVTVRWNASSSSVHDSVPHQLWDLTPFRRGDRMKVNESRTVVGGLIGHSTGRRSLSTAGGGHTCVPPTVERDRRACSTRVVYTDDRLLYYIFGLAFHFVLKSGTNMTGPTRIPSPEFYF